MKLQRFLLSLGAPVQDAEEETFELFTQDLPSQNLGFIDSRATTLELTVARRDLVITQSPGILSSNRAGGTTGAVTWKITPLFAAWLASPHNPLWTHALLTPTSRVLELGCGISGLVGLLLGPHIARYVLTDQPYVAKLLEQNLDANWRATSSHPSHSPPSLSPSPSPATTSTPSTNNSSNKPPRRSRSRPTSTSTSTPTPKTHRTSTPRRNSPARAARTGVVFTPLDWETDGVTSALAGPGATAGFRRGGGVRLHLQRGAGGAGRGDLRRSVSAPAGRWWWW